MKRITARFLIVPLFAAGLAFWGPNVSCGEDQAAGVQIPEGVYIKLTRDFYEALRDEGCRGPKVYSNDPSQEYLKQIAISAKFMVETNLEILKTQERIIQRLEALSKKGKQ